MVPAQTIVTSGIPVVIPDRRIGCMPVKVGEYMKNKKSIPPSSEHEPIRQRLAELRRALLNLHKALVDSERVSYEQTVGKIQSPNHFLQLVTGDPWFAWLQPFSQLIVAMDEALEEKEPLTPAGMEALVKQTRQLLVASETGEGFSGHYFAALQRDPDVVLAHAEVAKLISPRKPPAPRDG